MSVHARHVPIITSHRKPAAGSHLQSVLNVPPHTTHLSSAFSTSAKPAPSAQPNSTPYSFFSTINSLSGPSSYPSPRSAFMNVKSRQYSGLACSSAIVSGLLPQRASHRVGPSQTSLANVERSAMVRVDELSDKRGLIRSVKYDSANSCPRGNVSRREGWYTPSNEHGLTSQTLNHASAGVSKRGKRFAYASLAITSSMTLLQASNPPVAPCIVTLTGRLPGGSSST